jgi:hypothetical protein
VIVNAQQYCPDATYIYIDTTTVAGKTMYAWALAAHSANQPVKVQTGCTCAASCRSIPVAVFKMCSVLTAGLCK